MNIGPLVGLRVIEVMNDASLLGLGMAGAVPGMLLEGFGATVTRVIPTAPPGIDAGLTWGRVWNRNKREVMTDDCTHIADLLSEADVALVYGKEHQVEDVGFGYLEMARRNPSLIYCRIRPSQTARGTVDDYSILVEGSSGFFTQLGGHRSGPIFIDVPTAAAGTTYLITSSVLALLSKRTATGRGGWSETSLYDGLLATLGVMIGRAERAPDSVETYWAHGAKVPDFVYECADGEKLQIWFGGRGMYQALLDVLGDEPSQQGYLHDVLSGDLPQRANRWIGLFIRRPRAEWVEHLRAAGIACEPVLGIGQAMREPHLRQIGLAHTYPDEGRGEILALASPVTVTDRTLNRSTPSLSASSVLEGVRVVDFSAFLAGPLAAQVLADLGADVIKVEPPGGEAMRSAGFVFSACQRGKRAIAIDLHRPESRPAVERLLRWGDVVVHNFRVGVAERLAIDEASVRSLNPNVIYCHSTAFGVTGPRVQLPGNDALMQAVTGIASALGGENNPPLNAAGWAPVDVAGGWLAACGLLAALYARGRTGQGQSVDSSLLGAGMLLKSGAFYEGDSLVSGPQLDSRQTGYGPGYRIYQGSDSQWFALVLPDASSWYRMGSLPEFAHLSLDHAPLRSTSKAAIATEMTLEGIFGTQPASSWVDRLRDLSVPVELIPDADRDTFRRGILEDPVNQQLGRSISYETADWGAFEQIGPVFRFGPGRQAELRSGLPGLGEHTLEILTELGFEDSEIDLLVQSKVVVPAI